MTLLELTALRVGVAAQKERGEKPTIAGAAREMGPGTLAVALAAEEQGRGHVEFRRGVPMWMPGPARYRR